MYQFFSVVISFLMIPILIRRKLKLSYTLIITALVLGLISGIGLEAIGNSVLSLISDRTSLTTILTVLMVSILGGLMKHYKLLDKVVETIIRLTRNKKNTLMLIPALMGLLVIPGGAMLSAPFVNVIGKDLEIRPSRRAAINLVFRHIAMFILPYSTQILLVLATVPKIEYPKLILYNLIFVTIIIFSGYTILLRGIKIQKSPPVKHFWTNLLALLVYTSPIYTAVILNIITGWPFYVTLIVSVIIVYILSNKKDFWNALYSSINWNTLLTIGAVLIIKDMVLNMEGLLSVFNSMFSEGTGFFSILFVFFAASIFFGFITGNISGALAIVLPMVTQLELSENMLYLYTFFIYGSSFLGYYFSPLHLCQVFTLDIMGVSTVDLYKEYKIYIPIVVILFFLSVFILRVLA